MNNQYFRRMKLALLNIGSELLRGRIVNTNAAYMGETLLRAGYSVETSLVIHDDGPVIAAAVQQLMRSHEVVLVTGGLGPTKDDITKTVLLQVFGGEMVCHAPSLKRIEDFLARRNRPLLEHNRRQADVPSTCKVLENELGTAPAMAFLREGRALISMPGVPFEMKNLMQTRVIPWLKAHFPVQLHLTRMVRTAGIPESRIAERMEPLEKELDGRISIAYLPSYDGTKIELKIAGDPQEEAGMQVALDAAHQKVGEEFAGYVYSMEDKAPDKVLAEWLLRTGTTFATAESCTGGGIAAKLVQHSGITAVFKGGVVAYQAVVKENILGVQPATIRDHGIVSSEVAQEMAEGARRVMGSDYAVAITGIAEAAADAPAADQPQAWIGLAGPQGTQTHHIILMRDRLVNLEVAAYAALVFALKQVDKR
jgi:nicotinamide-nucleotide amidase